MSIWYQAHMAQLALHSYHTVPLTLAQASEGKLGLGLSAKWGLVFPLEVWLLLKTLW